MSFFKRLFSTKSEPPPPATNVAVKLGSRERSGSFSGSLELLEVADQPRHSGHVKFQYSATHNDFFVDTIVAGAVGGGAKMHQALEDIALHQTDAKRMVTATSRPGYFRKMGYDYTATQQRTNQRKFTALELAQQEQNRDERGGGFEMEKVLVRRNNAQFQHE